MKYRTGKRRIYYNIQVGKTQGNSAQRGNRTGEQRGKGTAKMKEEGEKSFERNGKDWTK